LKELLEQQLQALEQQ